LDVWVSFWNEKNLWKVLFLQIWFIIWQAGHALLWHGHIFCAHVECVRVVGAVYGVCVSGRLVCFYKHGEQTH
jgi:hypothetical protein